MSRRWYNHRYHLERGTHNNHYLQRAWTKLGASAFQFSVAVDLSAVPNSLLAAELDRQEALLFASHGGTYNLLHPGPNGPAVQPETRLRLSAAKKAMWARLKADPQALAELIDRSNAWKRTPDGARFYSEVVKARWADPAYRAAMLRHGSEKWDRPGFRENHAAYLGAEWADPVKREKRVAGLRSAWANPEVRANRLGAIKAGQAKAMEDPNGKMRQRPKKRWAAPDARAKQADKSKETWADPEIKARRCDALKAAWARRKSIRARQHVSVVT
jgi:hypothetical protein